MALTAREEAASSSLEADETATMRSHAAAPDAMNDASATLEWNPTMVLSGRKLKGASMSRLSLNALSACADDARIRLCSSFVFVQLRCGRGTRSQVGM